MCGIVLGKSTQIITDFISTQYKNQRHRGTEGYGIVDIENKNIFRSTSESQMKKVLRKLKSNNILFHHRQPSFSPNLITQTHPFIVETKKTTFIVVHNGVISNRLALKTKHEKIGYKYKSEKTRKFKGPLSFIYTKGVKTVLSTQPTTETFFNDSECLAIELARYFSGETNKKELEINILGWMAFVCIELNNKTENIKNIYVYADKTAPLSIQQKRGSIKIASELDKTNEIDKNILYKINGHKLIEVEKLELGRTFDYSYNKPTFNDYDDFGYQDFNTLDKPNIKALPAPNNNTLASNSIKNLLDKLEIEKDMNKGIDLLYKIINKLNEPESNFPSLQDNTGNRIGYA